MSTAIGITTNMGSITGIRHLAVTNRRLQSSMTKLTSGLRINSAADDAAGMAVATGFRANTRSQMQAQRNANDSVAMLRTVEGSYDTMTDIMIRMRELAIQAANDTLTDDDRQFLDAEFQQLVSEIDRISEVAEFNGIPVLNVQQTLQFQVGINDSADDRIEIDLEKVDTTFLSVNGTDIGTQANAQTVLSDIDDGLAALSTERSMLGATMNQLTWAADSLGIAHENLSLALSQIRDVDIAQESAAFQSQNILMQSGVAMLAQANQQPNLALRLLQ